MQKENIEKFKEKNPISCEVNSNGGDQECADELQAAKIEIVGKNDELERREEALDIAHKEIVLQEDEIEIQATELEDLYHKLLLEHEENKKITAQLVVVNKELLLQNDEKDLRAEELFITNIALTFETDEKKKTSADLIMANETLALEIHIKQEQAEKLNQTNEALTLTEASLTEHIKRLEEMIFMVSHKVRQPVANILGLCNLFDLLENPSDELKKLITYNRDSAVLLDAFTKELTMVMNGLKMMENPVR